MNDSQFEGYLEILKDQLIALQQCLAPFDTMDADLKLINQLHLQGFINDPTRVRLELVIGGIATLQILSKKVVEDIEDHFEYENQEGDKGNAEPN
jgi:hypothetical protein